jgi:molybdate transport system ATP-binding protein
MSLGARRQPRTDAESLIELEHCSVVLGGRAVLDDVNFELRAGQRWVLYGENGAGKTLLLKMLRGDVWPTPDGRERRIYRSPTGRSFHPPLPGERIPYVGPERQDRYDRYDWNFTVREVVTTGLFDEDYPLTCPSRAERARISRLLGRFALESLARRRLLDLSYGQRRLVMVARAFAGRAPFVLLDEVFNGLDAKARRLLMHALERPGLDAGWIVAAHRYADVPQTATHLLRLRAGRIVERRALNGVEVPGPYPLEAAHGTLRPAAARALPRAGEQLFRLTGADVFREYRPVLRGIDWTIHRGEHWAIRGGNGAGKSTLLRLIYGDLHPALGGRVERAGHPRGTAIESWKRRVGFVSPDMQAAHALAGTIEEVAVSGLRASVGLDSPPTVRERRRARDWLSFLGIEALRARTTREVSYGQMRLALLARALANDPELLLLDEPFTGLDPTMRLRVLEAIESLVARGTQIVIAAHHDEDIVPWITHILEIRPGGTVRIKPNGGRSGVRQKAPAESRRPRARRPRSSA